MADIAIQPVWQVLDGNGTPLPGAKASFFASGTTTPMTVYTDIGLTVAHATPVVADANGVFPPIYLSGAQAKCVITTSAGVAVKTIDPIAKTTAGSTGAAQVSFSPTGSIPSLNVQDAIEQVQTNLVASSSTFAKTLLDDTTASAMLTTLGATAEGKTLFAIADLAALLTHLGFASTQASPGNFVSPNGLIIKAGVTSAISAGGGNAVTFAAAFPNNCIGIAATPIASANNTNVYSVGYRALTTAGATITNNSGTSGSVSAFWLAVGY